MELIYRMRESAEAIKYNTVYPKRKRERDGESEMMRERDREIETGREGESYKGEIEIKRNR